MPFTLAHAAAALPFRKLRLVPSALVIGTFAPDFEYFLHLAPDSGFGHTLVGALVFTLPLALAVLWLYHSCVKALAIALLPRGLQLRLMHTLAPFQLFGVARFLLILASLLLGIATHIAWDNLTHPNTWVYQRWSFLGQPSNLPILSLTPHYKILQHASTLVGIALLSMWFAMWYRATPPATVAALQPSLRRFSASRKLFVSAQIAVIAMAAAMVRVIANLEAPGQRHTPELFAGEAICTFIAVAWWELVAYGLITRGRQRFGSAPPL